MHIKNLLSQTPDKGIKLGLANMLTMDRYFGFPSRAFASVHIAGTNGKGSVATKIAKTLELSGYRVGLFTSPHITSICERIQINSQMISEEDFELLLARISHQHSSRFGQTVLPDDKEKPEGRVKLTLSRGYLKSDGETDGQSGRTVGEKWGLEQIYSLSSIKPTYFETVTMAAFLYFAQKRVDVAVVETGMGGRLDATNIVVPKLTVVTSIDYDHTQYLGTTLEQIAREKGGIIKSEVPLLLGPQVKPIGVFHALAEEKKAPVYQISGQFADFDEENSAIAKKACTLLPFEIKSEEGFVCTPPCRFEVFEKKVPVVIDVAHNPAALEALFRRVERLFSMKPIRALAAFSAEKEIDGCVETLMHKTTSLHLTEAHSARASSVAQIAPRKNMQIQPDLSAAFHEAYEKAQKNRELLLICGTFYFMDWIKKRIGAL